ncbi:MAG: HYR domain-containing protein [Saprospiraceae bacterium]|nr:HYR domain-containing protein [Saprospiraceae bacterium]
MPSGSEFPIGTTTNCFSTEDAAGNEGSCCFNVTVNNYPNPTNTLACNDEVIITVDEECNADINADMILEGGPYSCYDDYRVEIFTSMPANTWNATGDVDNPVGLGSYWVGIYDATGNNCWGHITVVDKLPPVMECRDITVSCDEEIPYEPAPEVVGYQTIDLQRM